MNSAGLPKPTDWKTPEMVERINKRYRSERNFRFMGLAALSFAGAFLLFLLVTIFGNGLSGFRTSEVRIAVAYNEQNLGVTGAEAKTAEGLERLKAADFGLLPGDSMIAKFPDITSSDDQIDLAEMLSQSAIERVKSTVVNDPSLLGKTITMWVPLASRIDLLNRGQIDRKVAEDDRGISDKVVGYFDRLKKRGDVRTTFNSGFFKSADSREPETAAVRGAFLGSLLTLFVTLVISFPIGVMTAIYLEEFAPKNRITDFIEVNINNLAAVPSIIFGLLGLAVFLGTFNMPRSAPLVGGLTLALMTLPTIVIASRAAFKAVPPSIRDGGMGIGASPLQVVFHHVLPLALPGIMTGTIIGMARALGESAPLLMVGMRAFVVDVPEKITDPATVLPVQVFLWSDSVERGFIEKTSAAIIVLLVFLIIMNAIAVYLRNRYERRW
jgi:phosphate transport system permease protein